MHFLYYQFDRVCKLFCEDPATSQSDEFFGVFDVYITSLSEARSENDNIRRKREEEEKIANCELCGPGCLSTQNIKGFMLPS